jgi:DNA modification methylase
VRNLTLLLGDCREQMKSLPDASVDSIITDPPYGLEFMGKDWDSFKGETNGFRRAENPNDVGRANVFGRTSARGPEYKGGSCGAGMSKPGIGERETAWPSHKGWNRARCTNCGHLTHGGSPCVCDNPNVVCLDRERVCAFQEWSLSWAIEALRVVKPGGMLLAFGGTRMYHRLSCAIEDAGWEIRDCLMWLYGTGFPKSKNLDGDFKGWGTALKPAWEPIILAMRPCEGTFAQNALKHGVAGLNIDGSRIGTEPGELTPRNNSGTSTLLSLGFEGKPTTIYPSPLGRWPANIILDEEAGAMLDETTGGASRFFYSAKVSKADRGEGNNHPTVKPLSLMRYLCRLTKTPTGGIVLDPFMGSGSTGVAAFMEGRDFIGIEQSEEYYDIACKRIGEAREGAV